jgi:hypothetical protein
MNVQSESLAVLISILQAAGFSPEFIAEQVRRFNAELSKN